MNAKDGPSKQIFQSIQKLVKSTLGFDRFITATKRVSGGCIAEAFQVILDDGTLLFVKVTSGQDNSLSAERDGLESLGSTNTIAVAQAIAAQTDDTCSVLILEWIQSSSPQREFWSRFGHQLAELHQANQSVSQFGYFQNNFIGSTQQTNSWRDDWSDFFAQFRLAFQGDLALERNLIDTTQRKNLDRLIEKLPGLLAPAQTSPALLHGDLWSGNFLCDTNQNPVIFDPAVFFGHHEYEFSIAKLFGGFDSTFYEAYHEVIPEDAGTAERIEIYQLYHLLNHLNLFGRNYWSACQAIISKYA